MITKSTGTESQVNITNMKMTNSNLPMLHISTVLDNFG